MNGRAIVWLMRVAGFTLFAVGALYWIAIVGVYEGPQWSFGSMPLWWKIAAPALAVLYPVAGVGLWMTVGWGVVLWVIVAAAEAVMHLGLPELFGDGVALPALHVVGLATFAALKMSRWRSERLRRRRG